MPPSFKSGVRPIAGPKTLRQIAELLTRQVFRVDERRKQARYRQAVAQIQIVQRYVFRQIHFRFLERHGQMEGSRLAQITVDRLFARANSLKGEESFLAGQFAADIASENQQIRNAAFISLLTMLELESADDNSSARRRIVDTIHWLKQFGEIPSGAGEADALARLCETLNGPLLSAREH